MSEANSWDHVCFKTRIWDMAERNPNGPRWRVTVEVPNGSIEPVGAHAEAFKDYWDYPTAKDVFSLTIEVWQRALASK